MIGRLFPPSCLASRIPMTHGCKIGRESSLEVVLSMTMWFSMSQEDMAAVRLPFSSLVACVTISCVCPRLIQHPQTETEVASPTMSTVPRWRSSRDSRNAGMLATRAPGARDASFGPSCSWTVGPRSRPVPRRSRTPPTAGRNDDPVS
jgi:hypothetical protein